jgi:hypothetical protein
MGSGTNRPTNGPNTVRCKAAMDMRVVTAMATITSLRVWPWAIWVKTSAPLLGPELCYGDQCWMWDS